jgi:geranylgeranyl diphosphate synthase type II
MFGGDVENALPLALAIEAVHTYSLIHDDLPCMDDDNLRRGKPTCHVRFGEANALLAGDALLTRAFELIANAESLSAELRIDAIRILAEASGDRGMLAGQVMDMLAEQVTLSEGALIHLHGLKTGALIRAACRLGLIAAGIPICASDPRIKAIDCYAEYIGLAFQVVDDILDCTGTEEALGKPIGSDAENGKSTFLSYMTVSEAEQFAVELTSRAISEVSDYDSAGVLSDFAYFLCNRNH